MPPPDLEKLNLRRDLAQNIEKGVKLLKKCENRGTSPIFTGSEKWDAV